MNQKMSYSSQQQLKKTIAARLKAAGSELGGQLGAQVVRQLGGQPGNRQSAAPPLPSTQQQAQPRQEVHTMPDGMSCAQDMQRAGKTGFEGISGGMDASIKTGSCIVEILAEPVCKKKTQKKQTHDLKGKMT